MIMKLKDTLCNTETATRMRKHTRITRDELTPRVTLIKKELPCHPRFKPDFWFNWVTVEKYIDDILVKTYSWLQTITQEEKEQFLTIDYKESNTPTDTTPQRDRKEYMKAYYHQHKDKYKKYYASPEYLEKNRQYKREHREELNAKARQWYKEHREEKLQKVKEYNKRKKMLNN